MSQEDQIKAIAKEVIKSLWPIILGACALIGLAITATSIYDNKVAKKEDVVVLEGKIQTLSNQVADLSVRFNAYKTDDADVKLRIKAASDSLPIKFSHLQQSIEDKINTRLITTDNRLTVLEKRLSIRIENGYNEKRDANGKVYLVPQQ